MSYWMTRLYPYNEQHFQCNCGEILPRWSVHYFTIFLPPKMLFFRRDILWLWATLLGYTYCTDFFSLSIASFLKCAKYEQIVWMCVFLCLPIEGDSHSTGVLVFSSKQSQHLRACFSLPNVDTSAVQKPCCETWLIHYGCNLAYTLWL